MNFKFLYFTIIIFSANNIFSSGLESNGLSSRARGMGYAMVAVSGDWSALHANPAAIILDDYEQVIGSEYEFFTGGMESSSSLRNLPYSEANPYRGDFIDLIGDEPRFFSEKRISSNINYSAFGYLKKVDDLTFGVGLYGSGSGTAWKDTVLTSIYDQLSAEVSYINGSANIPFVLAYKVTPELTLGYNLSLHWGLLTVKNKKERSGYINYLSRTVQDTEGTAFSHNLGLLYKFSDQIKAGFVVKLPYDFKKDGTTEIRDTLAGIDLKSDTKVIMDYPLRLSAGLSCLINDKNLLALSLTWMNYSEYNMKISYKNKIPMIFDDYDGNPSDWEDTIVANIGHEYYLNEKITLRSGITFNQAPEPEDARTLTGGQVLDSWLFHFGAGIKKNNYFIDCGYIFTYSPEEKGFIPDADYSMKLHELFVGITFKV